MIGRDCPNWFQVADHITLLPNGCWGWTGRMSGDGYGRLQTQAGRTRSVHRSLYEYFRGPVPEGLVLDHLCRNRSCSNPDHLEPVTRAENSRRGYFGQKTHCPQGHPYDDENTYVNGNRRYCRACQRKYSAEWIRRRRAEKRAA